MIYGAALNNLRDAVKKVVATNQSLIFVERVFSHWQVHHGRVLVCDIWPTVLKLRVYQPRDNGTQKKWGVDDLLQHLAKDLQTYLEAKSLPKVPPAVTPPKPVTPQLELQLAAEYTDPLPVTSNARVVLTLEGAELRITLSTPSWCDGVRLSPSRTTEFFVDVARLHEELRRQATYGEDSHVDHGVGGANQGSQDRRQDGDFVL